MMKEKPKVFVVYCATNIIDGKQYVGCTDNFTRRKKEHIAVSKNPTRREHRYFAAAIAKHGIDNFKWNIVKRYETREQVCNAETFYIKKWNTLVPNGYNLTSNNGAKKQKTSRIPGKTILEIKELIIEQKLTYEEIATKYHIAFQTVSKIACNKTRRYLLVNTPIINRTGVEKHHPNLKDEPRPTKKQLQKLLDSMTIKEIGKIYNVCGGVVSRLADKLGCIKPPHPFIPEWKPTKEELQQLVDTYSSKEIATRCGVHVVSVNTWIKEYGCKKPLFNPSRPHPQTKEELQTMLFQMPIKDIAKLYGLTSPSVQRWIRIWNCDVPDTRYWSKRNSLKGEKAFKAKLDNQKVREIRASKLTAKELAVIYSVAEITIRRIRAGTAWKDIK